MYVAKEDFIVSLSTGLTVLHLGCVGFTDLEAAERVRSAKQSLHWKLTQCSRVVGVDRSASVIDELSSLGIFGNVIYGDVEQLDELAMDQKFDVVIAGDIIEHLSNPGRMLDGIQRFCTQHTRIVITTPNSFGAPNFLRFSLGRFREGAEHVLSFNQQNLTTLLERHGYVVTEAHTCFQPRSVDAHGRAAFQAAKIILNRFPRFGGTLLVVAKVNAAPLPVAVSN